MWIEGKQYKSLNFSVLKDKLADKSKTQTYRTTFIPKFKIGEKIALTFKKEFLYFVIITEVYPVRLRFINEEEAKRDGFNSILEMQKKIMELNNNDDWDQWGFIIRWEGED